MKNTLFFTDTNITFVFVIIVFQHASSFVEAVLTAASNSTWVASIIQKFLLAKTKFFPNRSFIFISSKTFFRL